MEVSEFMMVLEMALAKRGVRYPLELTAPSVLGQRGKYLGDGPFGPMFGFKRRQCRRMLAEIQRAARADAAMMEQWEPEATAVADDASSTSPEDR
jgi:hypothetical protein